MNIKRTLLAPCLLLLVTVGISRLNAQNPSVLTWHNDNSRDGLNTQETILTRSNVKAKSFGKVGFYSTDGKVDAQPLYVPALTIAGAQHDVLFIASEHGSIYAKDAESGAWLWKTSLLQAGETTSDDFNCAAISPEIGVTATPVIDLSKGPNGAIYVVNMSKDNSGNYHQRINALDLVTGAQLFGGPTEIQASYPGTGDNSIGGNVVFDPKRYAERAALLEWNGDIYTTWSSHCDTRPYTGWVIAYSASTLQQSAVFNVTPNGSDGAVWMSGAGPAATSSMMLFMDGNGDFDTTLNSNGNPGNHDFGNAFLALAKSDGTMQVRDYYATDTTVQQSNKDTDLGSGGAMVLPDMMDNSGNTHYLAVGAGKDTNIYVVDRFNMGKYHPNGGYLYQLLPGALVSGAYSTPAYFNNTVYFGGVYDAVRAFPISNAKLATVASSRTAATYQYPGATPSISANGTANSILWAVNNTNPAVLYAYNAQDLSDELYDSNQSGTRDQFGNGNKFIVPLVVNGHVFVGTGTGVAVFGLLGE
jgi:hypothetical protein